MSKNTNSVHESTAQAKGTEVRDLSAFRLKQIKFENYRCFERLTLDLHPNLTVIVGTNGAGKTAILDGIATALAPAVNWLSSANQRLGNELPADDEHPEITDQTSIKDKDFRITQWGEGRKREFTKQAEIAKIAIETTSGLKWDTWQASIKGKKPAQEIGQQALHQELLRIQDSFGTEARDYLPVFAYYGVGRGNFTLPQRLRDNDLNYSYPTTALHQSLNAVTDMRELLVWFDSEEAAELRQNRYVEGNDFDPSPILQTVRSALETLLGKAYRNPRINKERKLVVDAEQGPSPLLVNQLSQGYQSMLALAMDYARRQGIANVELFERNADTAKLYGHYFQLIKQQPFLQKINLENLECEPLQYTPGVVLIDEVDLHLHPQWQQRVLSDLLQAFPLTQFIVTTHSPQVLSTVPSECIRIIDDGCVYSAPPGTKGAESSRILKRIFGVDTRPQSDINTQLLNAYETLVYADQWSDPEAQDMRQKLDEIFAGEEPKLTELDLYIENRRWELGLEEDQ